MRNKILIVGLIMGSVLGTSCLAENTAAAKTDDEKQTIVDQSRQQFIAKKENLLQLVSKVIPAPACGIVSRNIDDFALSPGARSSDVISAYEMLLPPNCMPEKTRDWILVQKGHYEFSKKISSAGWGGASGYMTPVEFTSLVGCIRGAMELRKHLSHPYVTMSACVEKTSGVIVPINLPS